MPSQRDSRSPLVTIEVDGASYAVPGALTVIQAMWKLGRPMIHGVGCLGGVCGACPISVRLPNQFDSKTALACQTEVQEGMAITFFPSDSSKKAIYRLPSERPTNKTLFQSYPETRRCTACRACTTVCPQGIDVMGGVRAAINGDFTIMAEKMTSCVMCGLCAAVCEVQIKPHRIGVYARRVVGAFYPQAPTQLLSRVEEIHSGKFNAEWDQILSSNLETLAAEEIVG